MTEDNEETKTTRTSLESLVLSVTSDELKYRNKYLPDPKRLSDDKIVCTVCSVSLASRVRKGKNIYIHTILGVLVCKDCYRFYGDGVFSTDEDGDDKYCRWCGQGGTLYLCSKCNCGFCKECLTKNMKSSAQAELENDNWKCLLCVPRPIFGSRAVCWASQELNNAARKNTLLKLRLEEEKLRLEAKSRLAEIEGETAKKDNKKKKRVQDSEDSDSSTVFIPAKRLKEDTKTNKSLNGSVKKHRRKYENLSSESKSSDDDHNSKWEKRKRKKHKKDRCLSSDESSAAYEKKRKREKLKKKSKSSSDMSSDSENLISKSTSTKKGDKQYFKPKKKKKISTSKKETASDSSDSEPIAKPLKKKHTHNKRKSLSNTSSEENEIKFDSTEKLKIADTEDDDKGSVCSIEADGNNSDAHNKETNRDEMNLETEVGLQLKKEVGNETLDRKENQNSHKTSPTSNPSTKSPVHMNDLQTLQNSDQSGVNEELMSSQQISLLNEDEYTLSYNESTSNNDEKLSLSQEDVVKVKVHLAIEWLDGVSSDIADLGNLIAERTNKFGERKVNLENLHSYDDVLLTLEKVKHLLGGVHSNFKQIEDSLEDKLKSWKILAGLEKSDSEEQLYDLEEGEIQAEAEGTVAGDGISTEASVGSKVGGEGPLAGDGISNETIVDSKEKGEEQPSGDEISRGNIFDTKLQGEGSPAADGISTETIVDIKLQDENSHPELNQNEKELQSVVPKEDTAPNKESEILTNDSQDNERKYISIKEAQDVFAKEKEFEEAENKPSQSDETILEPVNGNKVILMQDLEIEGIDNALVKAELNLKSGSSNLVWSGLFSSEDDSDLNDETAPKPYTNGDNEKLTIEEDLDPKLCDNSTDILTENKKLLGKKDLLGVEDETLLREEGESAKADSENFKALQELLYSSTEPEIGSSESESNNSDDLQLDDSDLEDILKPRKVIIKKTTNKKELKAREESNENLEVSVNDEEDGESQKKIEAEKKEEKPLDSEEEIDMLTDLSKLKKKTVLRRIEQDESSEEGSSEGSEEGDGDKDNGKNKKRRKKYNTEIKKKREEERNELFGFLQGDSSAEDEVDITKDDLDVMEDQYVSESSDSMSLTTFSRKMNEKWRELEQEQDQLNLQMLLASESDEGSNGGDDLVLDSSEDKKKKGKKIKEEKINEEKASAADDENEEKASAVDDENEEKASADDDENEETEVKIKEEKGESAEPDQKYEQFLEDFAKTRTTFTGLGSSSEEDKDEEEIEIKEEALSDYDTEVKKEPKDSDKESTSNSDTSADLFLDKTRKKLEKKTVWRQHKLLRIKLSDTDTSDEERWWQRRLEREKKKKEQGESDSSEFDEFTHANSPKKSNDGEKKKEKEDKSDKENKKIKKVKHKEDDEANSSSTLEMSSTDSSGSDILKKKKKKKKESSDSDVFIVSDTDKKKKKKKKRMNLSGDSSNESEDSDDDVIDITQKSSQGESPGKGGRKNIRKVLTKHELAAATKAAAKEEEERKKRIAARQKLFNEMFEIKEAEILEKLVLDFDPETKTELISVDKDLVTKMKPHQAKGVKFMWDSCFESLSQLKTKKGSGCILAHCMGLGKTFQVVSLVHTILTHKDTNVSTVLVVCPLSTVLNWYSEFDKWLEDVSGGRTIKIYHLTRYKKAHERSKQLTLWHRTGGVMILGYEMFRILANPNSKKFRLMHTEVFQKTLIDPGADLVVCDEGHMLKNESTLLSKAMSRIRTLRRIVLTGTPMQNNLKEYHCMVQFVKPNLLGTRKEFLNQFVNPITNGQFVDSTEADVKVMKRRAHVLHKMLEGLVQRFDYSVLTPFLPPKQEYVISLRLSDVQVKLYQFYLDTFCQKKSDDKRTSSQLFQDWQVLGRVWTHPRVLKMSTDKAEKEKQLQEPSASEEESKRLRSQQSIKDYFHKKANSSSDSSKQESEDEGSIKDFINDKSCSSSLSLSSSSDDEKEGKKDKMKTKKREEIKRDVKASENKEIPAAEVPAAEPVDEINLISSEEEDGNEEEVKEVSKEDQKAGTDHDGENKANDSGIEDQDGKPSDEPNTEEKTKETNSDDIGEKESKEDEKSENKEEKSEKEKMKTEGEQLERRGAWWKGIIEPHHLEDINQSAKLVILFAILRECEMIEDKVLVFSQSLFSLDMIEYFLAKVDSATEENRLDESLGNHAGCWQKGLDYFRLDGTSSSESRSTWCKSFNREDNPRARLFLISTRAGGLGINLTGANRVVIFDASWNPSHDIQSIFRIYRFGQKKPCYVYRFVAHGTMEEKVYDRQVAKQLLSSRVVDEQQVQRHFSMNDLNELYTFTPPHERAEKPTPVLPKDRLMAELLTQYNDWIEKYHEHDSLLENIAEEELNEEERKLAWEDYENEKKRGFLPPAPGTGFQYHPVVANQIELFRKSLQLKFPNATEAEMNAMLQTLMFQVNLNTKPPQAGSQQPPGQQGTAGPSQQQQNFRPTNSTNMGGYSQPFTNMIKNMVFQNYFKAAHPGQQQKVGTNQINQQRMGNSTVNQQRMGNSQVNQQRMGNSQVNQQRMGNSQVNQQRMGNSTVNQQRMGNSTVNQQMVGNGQIRKTNRSNQELYLDQMRKQHEANLLRIRNQKTFQQQQTVAGQQPTQRRNIISQPGGTVNRVIPQPTHTQIRNQQGPNVWKPNQPTPVLSNRSQQMQKQRANAVNIVNARKQMPVTPTRNSQKPAAGNSQQYQWKNRSMSLSQQKMQEEIRQRIKEMQRQKNQQTLRQKMQVKRQQRGSLDPAQQRQLEEMKKRYNASRMKQSAGRVGTPISIVEIDDEPGT